MLKDVHDVNVLSLSGCLKVLNGRNQSIPTIIQETKQKFSRSPSGIFKTQSHFNLAHNSCTSIMHLGY